MHTWPWRRFEEFFRRHLARIEREKLERKHDLMVAAVNSNPNYDSKENSEARQARLTALDEMREEGIRLLNRVARGEDVEEKVDPFGDDPLFGVYKKGARNVVAPTMPEAGAGAALMGA